MGFGVKQADIAAIKGKTDNLPADPASQTTVVSQIAAAHVTTDGLVATVSEDVKRDISPLDFWSDIDDVIDLQHDLGAQDTDLPNVVVSGLPDGIELVRVVAVLKVRAIENTSASGANAISGAQVIQVRKSAGTWVTAINLPNNLWTVAASTRESGDVLVGDNDVKSEVDGDGTYNLRFHDALVDYDNLRLNDVMIGLRFYYKTP